MKNMSLPWLNEALQSAHATQVRRRIFRQLVESLIYEKVIPCRSEPVQGHERLYVIETKQEDGQAVTYRFRGEQTKTFGRLRMTSETVMRECGGVEEEADSLRQFLLDARAVLNVDAHKLVQFIRELEQTWLKDSVAQFVRHQDKRELKGADYNQLEHRVMDGHPYHPSYKSRVGFDLDENYRYGPEFAQSIRLVWLGVSRQASVLSFGRKDPDQFIKEQLGEERWAEFAARIRSQGKKPEEVVMVPVHPWQWKKHILPHLQDHVARGSILYLGESADEYGAQQSIRTLANRTHPEKPYVKLALSIVNTSTGRILAPHTVQNAAPISDWLETLVREDAYLRDDHRLILLKEVAGLAYHPQGPELLQADTYGVIGCIWRESLETKLLQDEQAIPFNALTAVDVDGKPFIDAFIQQAGLENWVRKLLRTSVLPLIHLLYAHGIAMESHAQNMVLVLRDNLPERLALKDFHDGLRFSRQHLTKPELCPALKGTPEYHARVNRNSFIETDDVLQVRDFMLDAFFFINLGELALFLAKHYAVKEETFWGWIHEAIQAYMAQFPDQEERYRLFDLYTKEIEVEQLTKRRLYPDTELRVHAVPNPLARIRQQEENHVVH
ncbi:IucA/IucC family protein [Laceyella putida]|uniref:IucA/IucC family protein n=1 Tax=Laceyella putida TaxID=110101 RepID=A0ABW2RFN8_9BACL